MLNRQRTRWGRGLIQTFHYHFHMLGNHKYHRVGLITLPYVFVFEFLAPVIEAVGFFMFIYLAITGGINWEMAWLIFAAIYTFSVMLSFVVIFYTYEAKCTYTSLKSFVPLMLAALVEPFLYHHAGVLLHQGLFQLSHRQEGRMAFHRPKGIQERRRPDRRNLFPQSIEYYDGY